MISGVPYLPRRGRTVVREGWRTLFEDLADIVDERVVGPDIDDTKQGEEEERERPGNHGAVFWGTV